MEYPHGLNRTFQLKKQAPNIDDTFVTNMTMEMLCGKADYRLHTLKQLGASSIILQQSEELRGNSENEDYSRSNQ